MNTVFEIQNLKCEGCENTIVSNLLRVNGISKIHINLVNSEVAIESQNNEVFEKVRKKLSEIGYPVVGEKNTIITKATSYVSCALGKLNTK